MSTRASSSRRPATAAATCSHQAARSNAELAAQAGQARAAARTASSTSAASAVATVANVSPDEGLTAGAAAARPARHCPPIKS